MSSTSRPFIRPPQPSPGLTALSLPTHRLKYLRRRTQPRTAQTSCQSRILLKHEIKLPRRRPHLLFHVQVGQIPQKEKLVVCDDQMTVYATYLKV